MKCPTPCIRCGRLVELHRLKHAPYCRCRVEDNCCNLVCNRCFKKLEKMKIGKGEE